MRRNFWLPIIIGIILFGIAGQGAEPQVNNSELNLYSDLSYTEVFSSLPSCRTELRRNVLDKNEKTLLQVCADQYYSCVFNGGCSFQQIGKEYLFLNFLRYSADQEHAYFFKANTQRCPFGYGTKNVCIDPYFSAIVGPTSFLKTGDVIEIPAARGLKLPTGEIHTGFFVVRDLASSLEDSIEGRVSLHLGPQSSTELSRHASIFSSVGLNNLDSGLKFRVITGEQASKVRQERNYPLVNSSYKGTSK